MGTEESTCWEEPWVLYGSQFDNKFHIKKQSFNIYLFSRERETETESKWGRGRDRGRHRIQRNSSPALGSVLMAQSLESASDSVSAALSASPLLAHCLSLSTINIEKNFRVLCSNYPSIKLGCGGSVHYARCQRDTKMDNALSAFRELLF